MALTDEEKRKIEEEERYRAEVRGKVPKKPKEPVSGVKKLCILIFVGLVIYCFSCPTPPKTGQSQSASTQIQSPVKEYIQSSCVDFCRIFGTQSKLSDLQKDEEIKKYKGKYVKWTGKVSSIDTFLGTLKVQIKCLPQTFVSDLIVSFEDDQKDALLKYSKDDSIGFEARIENYGALIGHSLSEGRLTK